MAPIEVRTYRYFGTDVPAANIDSKFGSYWASIALVLLLIPGSRLVVTVVVALFSGWEIWTLTAGMLMALATSLLSLIELPMAASRVQDRGQLVKDIWGAHASRLRGAAIAVMYASIPAWHVAIFLVPPAGSVQFATLAVVVASGFMFGGMTAFEFGRGSEGWRWRRTCRTVNMTGAWMEFGTDFASGITACQEGLLAFGIPILVAGCAEFALTAYHTDIAFIYHTKRSLLLSSALEVPVMLLGAAVLYTQRDNAHSSPTPHIISIVQTLLALLLNLIWLYIVAPRWQAHGGLVGSVTPYPADTLTLTSGVKSEHPEPCPSLVHGGSVIDVERLELSAAYAASTT